MDNQIKFGLNILKQNNKLAYLNGEFICLTDKFNLNEKLTIFNIFKIYDFVISDYIYVL